MNEKIPSAGILDLFQFCLTGRDKSGFIIAFLKFYSSFFTGKNKDASANPQHLNFAKLSSAKSEDSYSLDEEELAEIAIEERNMGRDVSGHVIFTSLCHLIAPCVVAPGSLTVTSEAVFFTVDEENQEYQKLDPKVSGL